MRSASSAKSSIVCRRTSRRSPTRPVSTLAPIIGGMPTTEHSLVLWRLLYFRAGPIYFSNSIILGFKGLPAVARNHGPKDDIIDGFFNVMDGAIREEGVHVRVTS